MVGEVFMSVDNNNNLKKYNNVPIIIFLVLMYVIVAMSDNFKGIFLPVFKEEFGVNNTQIGYVLTASLFGYSVFQYIGGILVEKIGFKKVISIGFIIGIASLLILVTCKTYALLVVGLFVLNAGMAMFNVGVNTLGPVLSVASTAVLMNFVNFSYGVSNTTIQKVSGNLLSKNISWQKFYMVMLVCCIALFAYLMLIKIPYTQKVKNTSYNKRQLFRNKLLYLYIAAAGFYLAAEYGIGNWFINYMDEGFGLNADKRAFYVALFFGLETFGRIFGGFIVDKLGYFKSILVYGSIASVLALLGITLGQTGLIIFSISGLFYSIIYPTIIVTIHKTFKEAASYATGLVLMCGTLIATAVSMLIGVINDLVGVQYSFYSIVVCLLLTTLMTLFIKNNFSKKDSIE
jgi:fucose permease